MIDGPITFEDIKKLLPHRYPFLLIDRIISVTSDSIKAIKNVTANEPFFSGHFPSMSVMPGVLQIEAMAQACGLILAYNNKFSINSSIAFLAGIEGAKFKKIVIPGDQLILHGKVVAQKRNLLKVEAECLVDGIKASSATITLVMKSLSENAE